MAGNHGGKRTPRNPAPVSGPGRLSRRTDGQTTVEMTGMGYGENADFNDIQSSAPLSAAPSAGMKPSTGAPDGGRAQATPLYAPTNRPDEPVTAGAPFGPGDTPPQQDQSPQSMFAADTRLLADYLPGLMRRADSVDAPAGFVRFVRYLRDMQGA